jgi:3-deoxy-D-manno-octulosonate 8-phosphate phosphatase (KDO 8-P phosphatase)
MQEIYARAARIQLVVFDVDGVLTDGSLILGDDGREHKIFHVRDGLGLVLLREAGLHVAVISARSSRITAERLKTLGVEFVYQGREDKLTAFDELLARLRLERESAAYVGDDLLDLPVMARAGLALAVADAHPLVIEQAHWTTSSRGGRGAAREVCELILKAQGRLEELQRKYLGAV